MSHIKDDKKTKKLSGWGIARNIFLIALSVVVVLALAVTGFVTWSIQRAFPVHDGELKVSGLEKPVEILRDDYGIPTIVAETSADLFFAQGFTHAQDRFWEMDFRRHLTAGRLSEWFGSAQLETDSFLRTLGWRKIAEEEVAQLDEQSRGFFQSYADGVNAYLAQRSGAELGFEYQILDLLAPGYKPEPWVIADSVAWLKAMAWDLRSNLTTETNRALLAGVLSAEDLELIFPEFPYDENPAIVPSSVSQSQLSGVPQAASSSPSAELLNSFNELLSSTAAIFGENNASIGSNSWVVSGDHSQSGLPILANDPHLGASLPSIWYQINLQCKSVSPDCPFQVSGFSFSGFPGVVIGHNSEIAWGFTNLGPDVADLYYEDISGDNYWYDGVQKPLKIREETIKIAGAEDVKITIRETENGPIVSELLPDYGTIAENPLPNFGTQLVSKSGDTTALSLRWTALEPGPTATAIFEINQAKDWESFRSGASKFSVPAQNLVYADVQGNIGYQSPGAIPIRKLSDGKSPAPGWDSNYSWQGYIPFEELPSEFNPERGWIVTANNAVVGENYPHFITSDWDYGYRANRIETLLLEVLDSGKATPKQIVDIQADNFNAIAAKLVPKLQLLSGVKAETEAALKLFENWDFQDHSESAAAAYFNVIWKNLLNQVFTAKHEELIPYGDSRWFRVVSQLLDSPDSHWWQNSELGITSQSEMLAHLAELAQKELSGLQGSNPTSWNWGKLHAITLTHQPLGDSGIAPIEWLFNRGPYPVSGGSSVVNATGWDPTADYSTTTVPSMRMVLDLSDFDKAEWIHLTGNSGHVFHKNYVDQAPHWQNLERIPWRFSITEAEKAAVSRLWLR